MTIFNRVLLAFEQRIYGAAVRNFSLLSVEKFVRAALAVLVGAWVLRYLGPEASGSITYIVANLTILGAIAKLGFDPIILRDVNLKPDQRGTLLGTAFLLQAVACALVFCTSIGAALFFSQSRLDFLLTLILALVFLAQPFDVFELWFQGIGRIEKPVLAHIASLFLISALRVCAILARSGLLVFSAFMAADKWFAAALNFMFFRRGRTFTLHASRECAVALLRESWPYLLSGLAVTLYMRVDQVMLGAILDKRSVGIFYAAVSLCEALYFLPMAISTSVFPFLTRLRLSDEKRYERVIMQYCNGTLAYSILITVVIWVLAPFVISLLYGPRYSESTDVLRIYVLCFCFVCSGVAQTTWFVNNRRGDVLLKKTLAGLIVNVSLNFVLIPRYGPNGAAWSTVAGQFVSVFGSNLVLDVRFTKMQLRSLASLMLRLFK